MSKFFYLAFAALAAAASFASGDTPVEWYTPSDYTTTGQIGYYTLYNRTTKTYDKVEINIGSDGSISEDEVNKIVDNKDYEVASTALMAVASALKAQAQVETLADTMYDLLAVKGIKVPVGDGKMINVGIKMKTDPKTGKLVFDFDANGNLQIDNSASSGFFKPDGKTLESVENPEDKKNSVWQLKGWDSQPNEGSQLYPRTTIWDLTGSYASILERDIANANTQLKYYHWVGADKKSVDVSYVSNVERFGIKGWRDQDAEDGSLADTLKSSETSEQAKYEVLARTKKNGEARYIPIGYGVGGGGGGITNDEVSIAKVGGTGSDKDKYQIAGFKDGGKGEGGCMENLSETLTDHTKTSERRSHKILTRFEESGTQRVHWMSIGDGIFTNADDGVSIDANADGNRQIKGFGLASQPALGSNDLTLLGIGAPGSYAEAKSVSWTRFSSVLSGMLSPAFYLDSDNKLRHSTMPGEDGQYAAQAGENGTISWSKIEIPQIPPIGDYMKADEHSIHRDDVVGNTNLCIKGANQSANKDKILFCGGKDADNNWQKIEDVMKSTNGISTAYGDTSATVGIDGWASPTCDFDLAGLLTGEDDAERQNHRFLTRYVDGDVVKMHYPKIGKLALLKTDEVSVTTNATKGAIADGVASVAGYADAEPDTVPHRKASGGIEWRIPSAMPTAVKIVGTEGAEVVGGGVSATNVIRFASASDSNVKVNVTKENGEVVVTIGVYWKE